jgi:hypothetical protein
MDRIEAVDEVDSGCAGANLLACLALEIIARGMSNSTIAQAGLGEN